MYEMRIGKLLYALFVALFLLALVYGLDIIVEALYKASSIAMYAINLYR
jgi:hypothetical protein